MEKLVALLNESAQNAFFLGTLLYGMFFAGQAMLARLARAEERQQTTLRTR